MPTEPIRKRVWVQNVAVTASVLQCRLKAITARDESAADPGRREVVQGVQAMLDRALDAAYRDNPIPTRWANWWRGTLIEAAYQNLHAAEAEIAVLYNAEERKAEVAEAVARVDAGLNRDDPRRRMTHALLGQEAPSPELLRKVIEIGDAATDRQHSRIRSFRNVVLVAAALIALFATVFTLIVAFHPRWVPLCFQSADKMMTFCPTTAGAVDSTGPSTADILVVGLLGLTGGAVAAAVAIRNMRGTSTPYDVPVALALLKVPLGALTAIVALIAIRGDFVPGLSDLDSQEQILAYAVVFGYAQQAITMWVDKRARQLLDRLPSKDPENPRPAMIEWTDDGFNGRSLNLPAATPSGPAARSSEAQGSPTPPG